MHEMYRELILDHARNPRNSGILVPCDIDHEEHNTLCGDYLHLTMRIDTDSHISDIGWEGEGCVISQASASILGEYILGKDINEIRRFDLNDLFVLLKIPITPNRMKCATLALKAMVVGTYDMDEWKRLTGKDE